MLADAAVAAHGGAVGTHQVVRCDRRLVEIRVARRQHAEQVAAVDHDPRLVERGPLADAAVERADHRLGVVREPVGDRGIEPAAEVVERGGQVPVIEREEGLDVVLQQFVDEPLVEAEAGGIDAAATLGEHAAPRHAEAVGLEAEVAHQRHVLPEAAVVVAREIARVAVADPAGRVREAVPDGGAGAVGERGAFDLVGRRRGTPGEAGREGVRVRHCAILSRGHSSFPAAAGKAGVPYVSENSDVEAVSQRENAAGKWQ